MQEVTRVKVRSNEEEPWQPLEGVSGVTFVDELDELTVERYLRWSKSLNEMSEALRTLGLSVGPLRLSLEDFAALYGSGQPSRPRRKLTKREKAERNRRKMAKASRKANRR